MKNEKMEQLKRLISSDIKDIIATLKIMDDLIDKVNSEEELEEIDHIIHDEILNEVDTLTYTNVYESEILKF